MKIESELVQKLKDKAFQTENDKKIIESFEIERVQQLTAVEWLMEELPKHGSGAVRTFGDLFEQAKEMEKQQIVNAHYQGYRPSIGTTEISEKYFNETFKSE